MRGHPLPWWQIPAIIGAALVGLGAIGGSVVALSKFLTLPERVEAGEAKDEQQDKQLDRLITLQEYYQQQSRQVPNAQVRNRQEGFREYEDGVGFWCCPLDNYEACWARDAKGVNAWRVCEE